MTNLEQLSLSVRILKTQMYQKTNNATQEMINIALEQTIELLERVLDGDAKIIDGDTEITGEHSPTAL